MFKQFSRSGIAFDKVYFCPHSLSEKCECRKPGTALVQRALEELSIDKAKSFFIGDMTSDVECGKRAGLKTILIQTGRGGADKLFDSAPTFKAKSLMEAATSVLTPA